MSSQAAIPDRLAAAGGPPPAGWLEFLRAHAEISGELDAAMRRDHGLSINEYEILLKLWLSEERQMRRVDLAAELLITQGGITRLLAGLERQGLVERAPCPDDARVAYARLTASGERRLVAARRDHLAEVGRRFADRYTRTELRRLADLLGRLGS